jgi:hypothetical protein
MAVRAYYVMKGMESGFLSPLLILGLMALAIASGVAHDAERPPVV